MMFSGGAVLEGEVRSLDMCAHGSVMRAREDLLLILLSESDRCEGFQYCIC